MTESALHFEESDFEISPLREGYHEAVIDRARFRTSRQGNLTLQVVSQIEAAPAGSDTVVDYFVLSGSSERARAVSRRRLIELYRACGLQPKTGDPLRPQDLVASRLEIRLGHEIYDGETRPRVLGYRRRS